MASTVFVEASAVSPSSVRATFGARVCGKAGGVSHDGRAASDESLVRRVLDGDVETFAAIVERKRRYLGHFHADDGWHGAWGRAQEAFIEVSIAGNSRSSSSRSWLFGSCATVAGGSEPGTRAQCPPRMRLISPRSHGGLGGLIGSDC